MSGTLHRIAAIVHADFLLRFRRISTVICFLLLSALAYLWIPPPSSGRALVVINDHRALNNSGAVGLATAALGMMFVGLFGYYFIANTIRRDLVTRCGIVTASTPMRSAEYLGAKFLGNLAFLFTFLGGFMLSSMAMLLVRGEAPLEPLVFLRQYLLLTPPAMVFVSAVAVLFESIPFLAGKLGDVLYFFVWLGFTGFVVSDQVTGGKIPWSHFLDVTGFGFMIGRMQETMHTRSLAIGASPFNPQNAPIAIPGLTLSRAWILPRLVSLFVPLLLLPIATLCFHRFDPTRTGRLAEKSRRNWIGRLQIFLKPITRHVVTFLRPLVPGPPFLRAIWLDALITLTLSPLALFALIGAVFFGLGAKPVASLPLILTALALVISDITTRDLSAGTTLNLRAIPLLRENFLWWKCGSIAAVSLLFCLGPLLATATRTPDRVGSLLVGIFFVVAMAASLGLLTSNPKTFIVGFLSFGYLVVSDKGASPMLDFTGSYGTATRATTGLYLLLGLAALVTAAIGYRRRLQS
jgi:hypothetical protein